MHYNSRFVAAAFGFALIASTLGVATAADTMAMPGAPTLTNARGLAARSLLPRHASLSGMLQQTSSCSKVAFQMSPAKIVPPIYRAVQIPTRRMGCVMLSNHYVSASIPIAATLHFVNVQTKTGSVRVPVRPAM